MNRIFMSSDNKRETSKLRKISKHAVALLADISQLLNSLATFPNPYWFQIDNYRHGSNNVLLFSGAAQFVRACPSIGRPPKPSFGYGTASFVTRDRSRNTLSTVIRRRSVLIRSKRCRTCATTAAIVDTGAGMKGPLSAAIFNGRQTKPIHTISVGAEN